jgi:uncharacterized protein (DUF1800 family)
MIPEENVQEPISLSLTPYTGAWTKAEAAHLLRRTMFGPTFNQITQAVTNGMNATVAQLLTLTPVSPPLAFHPDEAVTATGSTWVNDVYPSSPGPTNNARLYSLGAWFMQRINQPNVSIQEKMCLFWDNHFGVDGTNEAKAVYGMHEKYRQNCLGNFKQLVKDMTIDPMMLLFLNGATNNLYSPNENYARELLELFTVGKGPQVGPGDYSNYTESDVAAGAKILTGWTVTDLYSTTVSQPSSVFYPVLHDTTSKTLSSYFGSAVIPDAGNAEYANYVDVIFSQPDMAKYLCRKIYRWFVNYDLTPTVESTVIADMASTLTSNNFEVLPVIEQLLKSEHFYDISVRGAIIKNPLELLFSMLNASGSVPGYSVAVNYEIYLNLYYLAQVMGMEYLRAPSVGGWTSYYQTPAFSRLWANSSLLKLRFDLGSYLTLTPGIVVSGNAFKLDALNFVNNLSLPSSAPQVIDDILTVFTCKGVSVTEKAVLKSILTNGQPDFEWTIQYNDYIADPGNTTVSTPVRQRVELVLYRLFQLPQSQVF